MSKLILNIGIDTSGQPYENIYVGLVSIKSKNLRKFGKEFKKRFPIEYRGKHKGSKLSYSKIKNIIEFLDKFSIKMYSTHLPSSEWPRVLKEFSNKKNIKEKIYALLYFQLISKCCFKKQSIPYNVSVCVESNVKIDRVLKYLDHLLKSNKYNVVLNTGYASSNITIKIADFIAAGHRKIKEDIIKKITNLERYSFNNLHHKYIHKLLEK